MSQIRRLKSYKSVFPQMRALITGPSGQDESFCPSARIMNASCDVLMNKPGPGQLFNSLLVRVHCRLARE